MWWFGLSSFCFIWSQWLEHCYALLAIWNFFDVCFLFGKWTLCAVRLFKVESLLPTTQSFVDISGEVVVWYKIALVCLFLRTKAQPWDCSFCANQWKESLIQPLPSIFWFVSPSTLFIETILPGLPLVAPFISAYLNTVPLAIRKIQSHPVEVFVPYNCAPPTCIASPQVIWGLWFCWKLGWCPHVVYLLTTSMQCGCGMEEI